MAIGLRGMAEILQWVKENAAYGEMREFRYKKEGTDQWIKGNIFEDESKVLVLELSGFMAGVLSIFKKTKRAIDDDGRDK